MKGKYRLLLVIFLILVVVSLTGCGLADKDMAATENIDIVKIAESLAEEGTFQEGDIYVDSILYGNYSQAEEPELLVLCKFKNNVHAAGLDRTLAIVFRQDSMEVVAYKEFGHDEVVLRPLPTGAESRILFIGRTTYQDITSQYIRLYSIVYNEWIESPFEGVELQEEDLCYITDDNKLLVVPQKNGEYPTEMVPLWEEQTVYEWDEHGECFVFCSEENVEETADEAGEKIVWDDLDKNGLQEYFVISNEKNGILSLYFNNELIYRYEEQSLRIVGINECEYIDLDNDEEKEIFVSFTPNVNSMPLMEWFVLKKRENGWERMEMYHENNDMAQNAFPISVILKEPPFELLITCEGYDKEIIFDATNHYKQKKEEEKEWNDSSYADFVGSNFKVGDEVGTTSAWGIWNIKDVIYEEQNCLVAEHGLQGPNGKYDIYGLLDVFFCYDENKKIKILDIVFREEGDVEADNIPDDEQAFDGMIAIQNVDWDAFETAMNAEEYEALQTYMPILTGNEKFIWQSEEITQSVTMDEFRYVLNNEYFDYKPDELFIHSVAVCDLEQDGNPELILDLYNIGGRYLILRNENGTYYGMDRGIRSFLQLQTNGSFISSGGAAHNYYHQLQFKDGKFEDVLLGYMSLDEETEEPVFYIGEEMVDFDTFSQWENNILSKDVVYYEVTELAEGEMAEPIEDTFYDKDKYGYIDAKEQSYTNSEGQECGYADFDCYYFTDDTNPNKFDCVNQTLQKLYDEKEAEYRSYCEDYLYDYEAEDDSVAFYLYLVSIPYVGEDYVSLIFNDVVSYVGAAHPASYFIPLTINVKTGEIVTPEEVLNLSWSEICATVGMNEQNEEEFMKEYGFYLTDHTLTYKYRTNVFVEEIVIKR